MVAQLVDDQADVVSMSPSTTAAKDAEVELHLPGLAAAAVGRAEVHAVRVVDDLTSMSASTVFSMVFARFAILIMPCVHFSTGST